MPLQTKFKATALKEPMPVRLSSRVWIPQSKEDKSPRAGELNTATQVAVLCAVIFSPMSTYFIQNRPL